MTTVTTPQRQTSHRPHRSTALVSALAVAIGLSAAVVLPHLMSSQPSVTRPATGQQSALTQTSAGPAAAGGSVWSEQVPRFTATPTPGRNRAGAATDQFQHGHGGLD